jgi:hypothetical protein
MSGCDTRKRLREDGRPQAVDLGTRLIQFRIPRSQLRTLPLRELQASQSPDASLNSNPLSVSFHDILRLLVPDRNVPSTLLGLA